MIFRAQRIRANCAGHARRLNKVEHIRSRNQTRHRAVATDLSEMHQSWDEYDDLVCTLSPNQITFTSQPKEKTSGVNSTSREAVPSSTVEHRREIGPTPTWTIGHFRHQRLGRPL